MCSSPAFGSKQLNDHADWMFLKIKPGDTVLSILSFENRRFFWSVHPVFTESFIRKITLNERELEYVLILILMCSC